MFEFGANVVMWSSQELIQYGENQNFNVRDDQESW